MCPRSPHTCSGLTNPPSAQGWLALVVCLLPSCRDRQTDTGLTPPYPVPVLIASLQLDGRTRKVRGHVSCCFCLAPDTTRLRMPGSRRKGREERNWRKGMERREGRKEKEEGRGRGHMQDGACPSHAVTGVQGRTLCSWKRGVRAPSGAITGRRGAPSHCNSFASNDAHPQKAFKLSVTAPRRKRKASGLTCFRD